MSAPVAKRLLVVQPHDTRRAIVPPVGLIRAGPRPLVVVKVTLDVVEEAGDLDTVVAQPQEPMVPETDLQAAPTSSGTPAEPGARIEAPELAHGSTVRLARLRPVAAWSDPERTSFRAVELRCEALSIEPARRRIALVWRGALPPALLASGSRARLWVALAEPDDERPFEARLGDLGRAHVDWAIEADAASDDAEELALERLALQEETSAPAIPLERYAAISAELAEGRAPRAEVLARHGFDETAWLVEERGWLERMAEAAMRGDATVAVRYGEHFVTAQDAFESPDELDAMLHEYVGLAVALERADEPFPVLERWSVSLAQWLRLDRHWQRRAQQEPHVSDELERLLAEERARVEQRERGEEP